MGWLDSVASLAARDHLRRGDALEAARLVLRSPRRDDRFARQLLVEISRQLIEDASKALDAGDAIVAWGTIECAGQCIELRREAASLRERILLQRDVLRKQQAWEGKLLHQVRRWDRQGRMRSALGLLEAPVGTDDGQRLKVELEEQLVRFEQYITEAREHLERGDLLTAKRRLESARAVNATDPTVVRLEEALKESGARLPTGRRKSDPRRVVTDRHVGFSLGPALVISRDRIVVGNPRDHSVDIPVVAKVHRRHALISRNRGLYRLISYADCQVSVNEQPVTECDLQEGDVLELGNAQCRWDFHLPVAGSNTAVLEQGERATSRVKTPDGSQFQRVVLLDEALHIRPRPPAHVVLPGLPCQSLSFLWTEAGLSVEVQGAELAIETTGGKPVEEAPLLPLPCNLVIRSKLDGAEWLGRVFVGEEPLDTIHLTIRDPFLAVTHP